MEKVGEKISYDRNKKLGAGHYAIVYEGLFKGSKEVAVKRIQQAHVNPAKGSLQTELITGETKIMLEVSNHQNILRFICYDTDDNFLYIVTELCTGSLEEYVNRIYKGPKFVSEKEILHQVTLGLSYLHKKKIVHRDIKPNNILIFVSKRSKKPLIKLADFGISKMLKGDKKDFTNTSQTNPNGTRGWMPPEVYESDRFDLSVDVWALGCIFAYILSGGKHPFGDDPDKRQVAIKDRESIQLEQVNLKEPYSRDHFAFELIKFMLKMDSSERPTVTDVKNSFFIPPEQRLTKLCASFKHYSTRPKTKDSIPPVSIDLFKKLLMSKTVDVNVKMANKNTPLHIFCSWCDKNDLIDFVQLLIENGADVNAKSGDGDTPLYLLRLHYKNDNLEDIVHLLTQKDINEINPKESEGDIFKRPTSQQEERESENVMELKMSLTVFPDAADNIDQPLIPNINDVLVGEREDRNDTVPSISISILPSTEREVNNDATTNNWQQEKGGTISDYNITDNTRHQQQLKENEEPLNEDLRFNTYYVRDMNTFRNLALWRKLFINAMIVTFIGLLFAPSQHIIKPEINHVQIRELLKLSSTTSKMPYEDVVHFYKLVQDVSVDVNTTDPIYGMNALLKLSRYYGYENLAELVEILVDIGIDVNATDPHGWNALHYLCRYYVNENLADLVRLLEKSNIDLQVKTNEGFTALHLLAFENPANFSAKKIAIEILSKDGDLLEVAKVQTKELLELSSSTSKWLDEDLDRFIELVKNPRIDINARGPKDEMNVLLKLTRHYGHDDLLQLVQPLIENGIDINATDLDGWNALHNLCRYYVHENLVDLIQLLEESNIDMTAKTKNESSALYLAVFQNSASYRTKEVVIEILSQKGDLQDVAKVRTKELLELCSTSSKLLDDELLPRYTKILKYPSVEVNAKDPEDGMNALLKLTRHYGHDNLIQLVRPLIKRGIDINATDIKGWNALHNLCAYYDHKNFPDLILLLKESNIDIKAVTKEGGTALSLTNNMNWKQHEILKIMSTDRKSQDFSQIITNELLNLSSSESRLLKKEITRFCELVGNGSANINATDSKDGMNALLKLTRNYGHDNLIELVEPLIERGIDVNATDLDDWNALHNLCRYYKHKNLIKLIQLLHKNTIEFKAKTKGGTVQFYIDAFEDNPAMLQNADKIFKMLPKEKEFLVLPVKIRTKEFLKFVSLSYTSRLSDQELERFNTLLRDPRVNVNFIDPKDAGRNALLKLTRNYGHDNLLSLIKPLIKEGIDMNATDLNGWNALHNLCRYYGHENELIDLIKFLEENYIDMEAKTNEGYSALYLYAYMNPTIFTSKEIPKILYKGKDFSEVQDGRTREFYLYLVSRSKLMEKNISRFTELVNDKSTFDVNHALALSAANATAAKRKNLMFVIPGGTALHILCRYYNHDNLIDLARPLIEKGVDINATDSIGRNALHFLFQYYDQDNLSKLVQYFIDKGIDLNAQTKTGWSPLHVLFRYYRHDNIITITKLFIESKKVDLNARNGRNWTPLHHFCRYYNGHNLLDIVRLLIRHGTNLRAKTVDGHTPFYLFKSGGKDLYLLIEMTSDPIIIQELLKATDISRFYTLVDWWRGSTDDSLDSNE